MGDEAMEMSYVTGSVNKDGSFNEDYAGATSKAQAKKILRLAIKIFENAITREYLDNKKNGIVGRKMYRDKWGYDELSAEVQWVGLNTQLIVVCEYFIRYLDTHSLKQTKKHFDKLWLEKVPKSKRDKILKKHQEDLFYRLNETIDGALRDL